MRCNDTCSRATDWTMTLQISLQYNYQSGAIRLGIVGIFWAGILLLWYNACNRQLNFKIGSLTPLVLGVLFIRWPVSATLSPNSTTQQLPKLTTQQFFPRTHNTTKFPRNPQHNTPKLTTQQFSQNSQSQHNNFRESHNTTEMLINIYELVNIHTAWKSKSRFRCSQFTW